MTPERWTEVKEALAAALARTPEERAAYVAAIGVTDPELGRELEGLLAYHAEEFFEPPTGSGEVVVEPALDPGAMFGPYQVESPLGVGGMGLVVLARDRALERPVALKFLSAALQQQEKARRRFLREAKAAAALDHPYICKIYQTGEEEGRPFIAMEYVRGETLRQRLVTAPLPVKEILRVCGEVAEALETAHAAQIVHRDLKPSNIMLTSGGHVKVLDFGVAKRIGEGVGVYAETRGELTETGTMRGTVAYMSPEQVRGLEVDGRSDIFSLGVVLYECLTGKNPFQAGSMLVAASQILHHTPPPLGRIRGDVPRALEQVVDTMLAKAPADRYQSAHELRKALARISDVVDRAEARGERPAPSTHPTAASRRTRRMSRRTIAALVAVAVALGGAGVWRSIRAPAKAAGTKGALSVAVMPFENGSDDAQNDYLANGIALAVTTRLHRAGLRVIPWETARRFDMINPMQVASTLRVDAVLTGSFQMNGERLRLTVSLVEGATGFISWTDEFEESFGDIFQVQTRIAQGVATNLGHELTGEAAAKLATTESSSTKAYDFYLQGAEYLQNGDRASANIAHEYFTQAVRIDPNLTDAQVGLGAVYLERFWNGWGGGPANLNLAAKSFENVLQRDATNMQARRGVILIDWYRGHGGESRFQFASDAAGANDIDTQLARAEAYMDGCRELNERLLLPALNRVLALDPGNQWASWHFPLTLHNAGRFADAVKAGDDYVRRFNNDPFVGVLAAHAAERLGDVDGARDRYDRATEPAMQLSAQADSGTAHDLTALLYAGEFHSRNGRDDRARVLWQQGLRLARNALANDVDGIGLHFFLASFFGVLKDRINFVNEETVAFDLAKVANVNAWEAMHLAGAHAHVGNTTRALEILRNTVRDGRLLPAPWMTLAVPALEHSEGFNHLLRECEAADQRLLRQYTPGS